MGKTYDQLDKRLQGWIDTQHIFFVATAPQRPGGHVNLSPKGHADTSPSSTNGPSPTWT